MTPAMDTRNGRFAILPLLGVALLGLAIAMRPAVAVRVQGVGEAILAGVTVVYLVIAMLLGRLTWRSLALLGIMLVAHAVAALVFGLALSVGDAERHSIISAWQLGLWDFAPAPLLIAAFAAACAALFWPYLAPRESTPAPPAAAPPQPDHAEP